MGVNYRVALKIAQREYVETVEAKRRARDAAVVAANANGITCQEIASLCEMSYGNARKIVQAARTSTKAKRTTKR